LNEKPLNQVYLSALNFFKGTNVMVLKEPIGVVLRLEFKIEEFVARNLYDSQILNLRGRIFMDLLRMEYFLAKIKNPVIIEVHTAKNSSKGIKSWELSTLIANELEKLLTERNPLLNKERVRSVGFGEFLPIKNTSNNGGNYSNRIDIMILCDISGE
jgi:flagellar motor protein MotB